MDLKKRKEKLENELKEWQIQKDIILQEQDLQEQKREVKNRYKNKEQKRKISTSKMLMLFLFISCSLIEFFTIYLTFKSINLGFVDFSALQSLITAVVAQVVGFAIYSLKALKENTKGGVVYETAVLEAQSKQFDEEENQEAQG